VERSNWSRVEKQVQKRASIELRRERERKAIERDVRSMERELRNRSASPRSERP
jgi:hypothetical protein